MRDASFSHLVSSQFVVTFLKTRQLSVLSHPKSKILPEKSSAAKLLSKSTAFGTSFVTGLANRICLVRCRLDSFVFFDVPPRAGQPCRARHAAPKDKEYSCITVALQFVRYYGNINYRSGPSLGDTRTVTRYQRPRRALTMVLVYRTH